MPLRRNLEAVPETFQEMELAAAARFRAATASRGAGEHTSAVYLAGYTAEMLLKSAYFRYTGVRPADLVAPRLPAARMDAKRLGLYVHHEAYHSLRFWALLLRARRVQEGRALDQLLDSQFVQRTRRLYQGWWVDMRYRRDLASDREADTVFGDVDWLRENYRALWR